MEDIDAVEVTKDSNAMPIGASPAACNDNEAFPDFTNIFTTTEQFLSRETLCEWVRGRAMEHGIVISVSRSISGGVGKIPRLWLSCERSGIYRKKKINALKVARIINDIESVKESSGKTSKRKRETGTKKCGCPFQLKAKQVNDSGHWDLEVVCGVHNHPIAEYLEGHSYAGRLLKSEMEYIADMSHTNSKLKDVLFALKKKFQKNKSTIKTIYNARFKNRVIQRGGRSNVQQLMHKLEKNGYYHHYRHCEKTNRITDLIFAHPKSIELLRAFPYIIHMDSTYKTNRYKLPLLEIVGVTSTQMTFLIAAAYLQFEKEDNYLWACTILKSFMDKSCLPIVILTDRELALMNAVEKTFPTTRHFLCRWHINKNILANCKKMFKDEKTWEDFIAMWNELVTADTEVDYNDILNSLLKNFEGYPTAIKYVIDQWLVPYKERFASCCTNNVMHFGNLTTNRVESQHALLKRQLGSSRGNFETCWRQIHTLIETSHIAMKDSFEKSKFIVLHKFRSIIFSELIGMVSVQALHLLVNEMDRLGENGVDILLCGCVLRKTCGLPCGHEISEYMRLNSPIPLKVIHVFWRKLDMTPIREDVNVLQTELETRLIDCFQNIELKFKQVPELEKIRILKRLTEILSPTTVLVDEPQIKTNNRGRPKATQPNYCKSTKRDPSKFEYVESIGDSCFLKEDTAYYNFNSMNETPKFSSTSKAKIPVLRQNAKLLNSPPFVEHFPSQLHNFIEKTINVNGDGHCGFRSVAELLGYNVESWGRVRGELWIELDSNRELYDKIYNEYGRVDYILDRLNFYEETANEDYWFLLPEMGYLVASFYNVAFVSLSASGSFTFLPLRKPIPKDPKLLCIGLVNKNHFVQVYLRDKCPLPPVPYRWFTNRDVDAASWFDVYSDQFEEYKRCVGNSVSSSPIYV